MSPRTNAPIHTDQPYLTRAEAAQRLRLSPKTLERLAVSGGGPRFCKFGSRVAYRLADLDTWAEARVRSSTSDKGSAA